MEETSYNKRDIDRNSMFTLFWVNTEYYFGVIFYLVLIAMIVYRITIKARTNSSNTNLLYEFLCALEPPPYCELRSKHRYQHL